jgi:hypothetical protein
MGLFDYNPSNRYGCGCATGPTAVLKAEMPSRVRSYVLSALKSVTASQAKLLQTWGKKWAKQIYAKMPKANKTNLGVLLSKASKTPEQIVADILRDLDMQGYSIAVIDSLRADLLAAFEQGGIDGLNLVGIGNNKDIVRLVNDHAVKWARDRAADLVGMKWDEKTGTFIPNPRAEFSITETMREGLRLLTEDALTEGLSADDFKERILGSFFMSEARAEMIARTELANAHVQGNLDAWGESGVVTGKQSILADTHPFEDVCDDNEAAGVIPLGDPFPSGDMGPPYHPNCLCDVIPVVDEDALKGETEKVNSGQLIKGAPEGHPFYGNQWTGAGAYEKLGPEKKARVANAQTMSSDEQFKMAEQFESSIKTQASWSSVTAAIYAHQGSTSGAETPENKKVLDKLFRDKAIALEKDSVFYRGLVVSTKEYDRTVKAIDAKKGVVIRQNRNRYVPTTTNPEIAKQFSQDAFGKNQRNVLLEVMAPKGSKVMPISAVGKPNLKHEEEVTFDRGSVFRVHSIKSDGNRTRVRVEFVQSQRHPRGTLKADLARLLQKMSQKRLDHFSGDSSLEFED